MRLNLIPPLEERNGMNGGERVEEEARQCTMDCGFCIVYVPSSTSQRAFNVRFSDSIDVYAHSRGRENVPDQFPSRLFFPLHSSLSTSTSPFDPRRIRDTSAKDGLIERCIWPMFSILFCGEVLVSRIFITHRVVRMSFLSCMFRIFIL